jgi:hypothetical protein
MTTDDSKGDRAPARWNLVAVFLPFLGLVCGFIGGLAIPQWLGEHPMEGPTWGMRVWFGFCALGLIAAVVALIRAERLWPITVLGFVLNVPLLWLSGMFLGGR